MRNTFIISYKMCDNKEIVYLGSAMVRNAVKFMEF